MAPTYAQLPAVPHESIYAQLPTAPNDEIEIKEGLIEQYHKRGRFEELKKYA